MLTPFETQVPAKWILTGEHAVIRGEMAIALPYRAYSLSLNYREEASELFRWKVSFEYQQAFDELIQHASRLLRTELPKQGELQIKSTIPVGAGLGSSAALCVALSRWFQALGKLERDAQAEFDFARDLENFFHGKSSGLDIATVRAASAVKYQEGKITELSLKKVPSFDLIDTGLRSNTREVVQKVERWRNEVPSSAEKGNLDQQMGRASSLALEALEQFSKEEDGVADLALDRLAEAMELAQKCFEVWGLIPAQVREQIEQLKSKGARAVKLTGAGEGGFLVALRGGA